VSFSGRSFADDADEARASRRRALELAKAEPERRFLERRLAEL
jgi:predicted RNA polymerase sigma factor